MKKNKTIWLFVMMVAVLPLIAFSIVSWYTITIQKLPVYGEAKTIDNKKLDHTISDFSFINQDGKNVT